MNPRFALFLIVGLLTFFILLHDTASDDPDSRPAEAIAALKSERRQVEPSTPDFAHYETLADRYPDFCIQTPRAVSCLVSDHGTLVKYFGLIRKPADFSVGLVVIRDGHRCTLRHEQPDGQHDLAALTLVSTRFHSATLKSKNNPTKYMPLPKSAPHLAALCMAF